MKRSSLLYTKKGDRSTVKAKPIEHRFWEKVDKRGPEDCWIWLGAKRGAPPNNYGLVYINGKWERAHRMAWQFTYNKIPRGMFVLHHCDNPSCCNPRHLFLGTQSDNIADMVKKGRQARGDRHGKAKLTIRDVRAIRKKLETGQSQEEIAEEFGLDQSTISDIDCQRSWGWLPKE